MPTLVTGAAGFIGYHVAERLLSAGVDVIGVDNLSPYYDVGLKRARLARLTHPRFRFLPLDIGDEAALAALFAEARPEQVIHLAAQPGVRLTSAEPREYVRTNVSGTLNVLEGCRAVGVQHLVYASSSSVYGANTTIPFSEHHPADHPVSLYAATKRSSELLAHSYSHLFGLPTTGLRFFTVYGPWGRPDMAMFLFTRAILAGRPIDVFNGGTMARDYTYVDDIVEGVLRAAAQPPGGDPTWSGAAPTDPATSAAPYRLYNLGNRSPVPLLDLIATLERALGKRATLNFLPMQAGDVAVTSADTADLEAAVGFAPATPIEAGVERYVAWYRDYYG